MSKPQYNDEKVMVSSAEASERSVDLSREPSSVPLAETPSHVAELEAKAASLEDALLRARAETQNVQRRAATERADAVRYGTVELVKSLLPVYDDLDRTLAAAEQDDGKSPLVAGVRLAIENFVKALREHGVEPVDAAGQKFDPRMHHALMQQSSDNVEAGTVLKQTARGFQLRDRVVRPAMVIVSRGREEPGARPEAATSSEAS